MAKKMLLNGNSEGFLTECTGPYAIIECETEDSFFFLQEALAYYKRCIDEGRFKPLTLDELRKMEGQTVYVDVEWGVVSNFEGKAIVSRVGEEGLVLHYDERPHSLLCDWYGQAQSPRWIAYKDAKPVVR